MFISTHISGLHLLTLVSSAEAYIG